MGCRFRHLIHRGFYLRFILNKKGTKTIITSWRKGQDILYLEPLHIPLIDARIATARVAAQSSGPEM